MAGRPSTVTGIALRRHGATGGTARLRQCAGRAAAPRRRAVTRTPLASDFNLSPSQTCVQLYYRIGPGRAHTLAVPGVQYFPSFTGDEYCGSREFIGPMKNKIAWDTSSKPIFSSLPSVVTLLLPQSTKCKLATTTVTANPIKDFNGFVPYLCWLEKTRLRVSNSTLPFRKSCLRLLEENSNNRNSTAKQILTADWMVIKLQMYPVLILFLRP